LFGDMLGVEGPQDWQVAELTGEATTGSRRSRTFKAKSSVNAVDLTQSRGSAYMRLVISVGTGREDAEPEGRARPRTQGSLSSFHPKGRSLLDADVLWFKP
jgi:hypothetical protein